MCSHAPPCKSCGLSPQGILATCHRCNPYSLLREPVAPYPDEIIMAVLDRIIYYSGATKIFHNLDLAVLAGSLNTPMLAPTLEPKLAPITACDKSCSTTRICTPEPSCTEASVKGCASSQSSSRYDTARNLHASSCAPKSSSLKSCNIKAPCQGNIRLRTPRVDFANPISDDRGAPLMERMKQSLSTCSLACKQIKTRLASSCKNRRWVWTRLTRSGNGCKTYEVYHTSGNKSPNTGGQPDIVFLVMPNGQVMPFETVPPPSSCDKS